MSSTPSYPYFKESEFAHKWLDPLAEDGRGIEVGGSCHNDFFIKNCINLDYTESLDTIFKQEEIKLCGRAKHVDIVAPADEIPFPDSHFDFLLNSHIFEHMPDPIYCLKEWHRVVRKDGLIYSVIPLRDALESDKVLPMTTIDHQLEDYIEKRTVETHPLPPGSGKYGHLHIYNLKSYIELVMMVNEIFEGILEIVGSLDVDDKVGNGFVIVHRVIK